MHAPFSEEWRLLPSGGYGSMIQMIMPSFVLAAGTSAAVMRLQQTSMTEVAGKEFITTERAKGLPMPFIMKRHVLPNALVPVITMLGTFFGAILGGSVIIEDMFSIPGLGSYVLAAIWGRDYPVIQGYVIVSGTVFLTFNYLVDILCGMLNPSVRKGAPYEREQECCQAPLCVSRIYRFCRCFLRCLRAASCAL